MTINTIIILIFIVLLIVVAILYRNSTLDKLQLLPGEKILFEESSVRVEQAGSPGSVIFFNCIVRVTNSRIIIAQKMLFRNRYALRFVIIYSDSENVTDLKNTFMSGFIVMKVSAQEIKFSTGDGSSTVTINIPGSVLTRGEYITYATSRACDYNEIMG